MSIKSPTRVQYTFNHGIAITNRAKQLIQKHPGIYEGNLIHRLQEEIKSIGPEKLNHIFFQLTKEGYDFKGSLIYPPNTLDSNYKKVKRFTILNKNLNDLDFEIFLAIMSLKERSNFKNIVRRVISSNIEYSEQEIRYRIGILFKDNFIIAKPSERDPKYLDLNWLRINRGDKL